MAEREFTEEDRALAQEWGARLEDRHPYLYRYISLEGERRDWFGSLMRDSTLFFAPFSELNDPFDSRAVLDVSGSTQEEIEKFVASRIQDGAPGREVAIQNLLRARTDPTVLNPTMAAWTAQQGVCCFTLWPDNLLMWPHYASKHKGLCLRFSSRALFESFRDRATLIPVTYKNQFPTVDFIKAGTLQFVSTFIGTKAEHWRHEDEWRLVLRHGDPGPVKFNPSALDGVIMGCRITDENADLVRRLTRDRGPRMQVLRAHAVDNDYALHIDEES